MCGWYKSRQHAGFLNSCCTCTWYQWRRRCDSNSWCVSFFFCLWSLLSFFHPDLEGSFILLWESSDLSPSLVLHTFTAVHHCLFSARALFITDRYVISCLFWVSGFTVLSAGAAGRVVLTFSLSLSLSLSAGVSGGKVQKLPASWRGRGRAAEGSLRREPPDCLWDHRSKVRHQTWWGKLPWEQRQWQDPREQLGSRVPAQRQGWNGSELRVSPAGLCWRRRPAGC